MNDSSDFYYKVIFTAELADNVAGYAEMAYRMNVLVEKQPGYMGRSDRMEGNNTRNTKPLRHWRDQRGIKTIQLK